MSTLDTMKALNEALAAAATTMVESHLPKMPAEDLSADRESSGVYEILDAFFDGVQVRRIDSQDYADDPEVEKAYRAGCQFAMLLVGQPLVGTAV